MPIRLTARVVGKLAEPKVKHYFGFPPELTCGDDQREQMCWPSSLTIEEKPSGVFLFRFAADGHCVGDTWHATVEEAKEQALHEFEQLVSDWEEVPPEVKDIVVSGLRDRT